MFIICEVEFVGEFSCSPVRRRFWTVFDEFCGVFIGKSDKDPFKLLFTEKTVWVELEGWLGKAAKLAVMLLLEMLLSGFRFAIIGGLLSNKLNS